MGAPIDPHLVRCAALGREAGAVWRRSHPAELATLTPILSGWLHSGCDPDREDNTVEGAARTGARLEAYRAGWCEGAGVDPRGPLVQLRVGR